MKNQISNKIEEIFNIINQADYKNLDINIMSGKSGILLFLLYYDKIF